MKVLGSHRKIIVNKLIKQLSTQVLTEFDAETRFRAMASRGLVKKGLSVLNKLDAHFSHCHATHERVSFVRR